MAYKVFGRISSVVVEDIPTDAPLLRIQHFEAKDDGRLRLVGRFQRLGRAIRQWGTPHEVSPRERTG
jgi:hypothetical protein